MRSIPKEVMFEGYWWRCREKATITISAGEGRLLVQIQFNHPPAYLISGRRRLKYLSCSARFIDFRFRHNDGA